MMERSDLGKTRRKHNKRNSGLSWYHSYLPRCGCRRCNNKHPDWEKRRRGLRRELMLDQLGSLDSEWAFVDDCDVLLGSDELEEGHHLEVGEAVNNEQRCG